MLGRCGAMMILSNMCFERTKRKTETEEGRANEAAQLVRTNPTDTRYLEDALSFCCGGLIVQFN